MRPTKLKFRCCGVVVLLLCLSTFTLVFADAKQLPSIEFKLGYVDGSMSDARGRPELTEDGLRSVRMIQSVSVDFAAGDEAVSALQFTIGAANDLGSIADIRSCSAVLPDTHIGGCKVKDEKILFYVFSPINAPLPSGNILQLKLSRPAGANGVNLDKIVMADVNGAELNDFRRPQ